MPPVFTDKGITAVVFLLYLFHIALELYRFAVLYQDACWMIAVGFEGARYAPQRSADVCVFLVPVATTDAGYLRFLVHILEFYLVAVLDENLRNVGVVAVTAAADAGRAAVGRHYHPVL